MFTMAMMIRMGKMLHSKVCPAKRKIAVFYHSGRNTVSFYTEHWDESGASYEPIDLLPYEVEFLAEYCRWEVFHSEEVKTV